MSDFVVGGGGTLYMLCPNTEAAKIWLNEHIPAGPEAQYLGSSLAVEHRYIGPLVDSLRADGYTVE